MSYQIASGYNNTAGYVDIEPIPTCRGIQYAYEDTPLGSVQISNGYAELRYSVLTPTEYTTLLTTMGLATVTRKEVTVSLPTDDRTFGDFNAIINRPRSIEYQGFYREVVFPIFNVEEI